MKPRKRIISTFILMAFALTACDTSPSSCSSLLYSELQTINVDPYKIPSDWKLDYWVGEIVKYEDLDERNIFKKEQRSFYYLDSAYSSTMKPDGTIDPNKEYVYYGFFFREEGLAVYSIECTDPKNTIYGLSMSSKREEIEEAFEKMGFEFLDYNGLEPCYMKERAEFRVYENHISVFSYTFSR